ncbi:beta-ketoacyl-[acyl-carrier-protein] synthase family protein [Shewanella avicenniae]|uniref:Beta-ketoacyl-[acyl-carrier-protein] synthase family protein n=2 Tax=Shewanella avicenniae TaxID=2814294 RepID=A0ABX7QXJ9_9GAMM|nr:beta-ketoacyl-[acyl-carrier-protein] synthase family protein [Shewanella avicenniae]QSX35375.1 beta-ketoacyl-[acyl-carrier-protein] synthase family protein [Shewanella avicenniae]
MTIAITHAGFCTPLGIEPHTILQALLGGDTSHMVQRDHLLFGRSALVGEVSAELPAFPDGFAQYDCRNNALMLKALAAIASAVETAKQRYGTARIGVVIGTSTSGIAKGEQALKYHRQHGQFPDDYHYVQQELGSSALFLRDYLQLTGPAYTVSTACSSSAKVFASGQRLLNSGLCDMVIVGGVDSLSQLTLNGFDALESIADQRCNPFSLHRCGINIGEGAVLFTLERGTGPVMLAGCGESADAHHISAPHPQGDGAVNAMQQALTQAGLAANQIDYVNLHGTATQQNDTMESRAMLRVFGGTLPPCSSTKPLTGHTLGAAGALEAGFCWLLLSEFNHSNGLPLHCWDAEFDPELPALPLVSQDYQPKPLQHLMSNSFAFGGSNASLIFSRGLSHE